MLQERLLIVVPTSLQREFLQTVHDKAGHQGTDITMARLSEIAYWVGMAKDVGYYCNHCTTCKITPLQLIVASRPWEMLAVDILKVPMSSRGNQYLLVIQNFFSVALCNSTTGSEGRKNYAGTAGPSIYISGTSTSVALRPGEEL